MTAPATATPELTLEAVLTHPDVLRLETWPGETFSQLMHRTRDVVELLGRKWSGAPLALKMIPAPHKAQLMHRTQAGTRHPWCLSPEGVKIYYAHVMGYDPRSHDADGCAEQPCIIADDTEKPPTYAKLLAEARARTTPLTIMLLLDVLPSASIAWIDKWRRGEAPPARTRWIAQSRALDLSRLIESLSGDDLSQIDDYIDYLLAP